MKKDNSIVVWRIFFSYVIAVYHFLNAYGIGSSLYLATDFFFIVSGFILANEAANKKYNSPFEMLTHRLKKYYPHYMLSLVITYIVFLCFKINGTPNLSGAIPELFLVQMSGINLTEMINVPTWYLSVLLISSYFTYFLLTNYRKLFIQFIIPIVLIISGTWFYRNYGYLSHTSLGKDLTIGLYWNVPLVLGFSMMCLGISVYYLSQKIPTQHIKYVRGGKTLLEVLLFTGATVIAVIYRKTVYDFIAVILMALAVMIAFSNDLLIIGKCKVVKYFSKLSYPLYLNHNMFRKLFPRFFRNFTFIVLILYLVIVTVFSMLTMLLIEMIQKYVYERTKNNGKNNYSSSASERN